MSTATIESLLALLRGLESCRIIVHRDRNCPSYPIVLALHLPASAADDFMADAKAPRPKRTGRKGDRPGYLRIEGGG